METKLGALFIVAAFVACLSGQALADDTKRQVEVEHNSEHVMPFDMNATMHSFVPNAKGGVQTVMVHDGDPKQVALVRSHLRKEATAFAHGDFTDPASIHGGDMPGLKAMHEGASHITVQYAETQNGASITYSSNDPQLVTAIHEWFKAQVSDHGSHASMKM